MIRLANRQRERPDRLMGLFPADDTRRVARCACGNVWTIDRDDDAPACLVCHDGNVVTGVATDAAHLFHVALTLQGGTK